jgi:hypothetical protein
MRKIKEKTIKKLLVNIITSKESLLIHSPPFIHDSLRAAGEYFYLDPKNSERKLTWMRSARK